MNDKPKVMQVVAEFNRDGGPQQGLRRLLNSRLNERFEFAVLNLTWKEHGMNLFLFGKWVHQIKSYRPDIVHVRGLQSEGFYGVLAAKIAGCDRIVLSIHGFYSDSVRVGKIKRWLFGTFIEPFTLRLADKVYCVCHYAVSRKMVRRYARNIHGVIWNAAPSFTTIDRVSTRENVRNKLGIPNDATLVLSASRMTYDKGFDQFSSIISSIMQRTKDIEFLLLGDGPYRKIISDKFVDEKRVHCIGSHKNTEDYFVASDMFITMSRHENLSNSLLEACEAGLAIIATDVGGNPEVIIDGCTGTLVESENHEAAVDAIMNYYENPEISYTHGERARRRVRVYFSGERIYEQIDELYSSLL